ncbi:MAG: hypothetical protein AUJ96_01935 [Armatimonadetes bacterium CG2_30_66_41]|nr:DeoR family transcriptional regulator [Armatimonadota bacterium]OIP11721.1 MAG: hypothetical protein AUJ96_01935 [Armatimonadetes bacterium CG2_30_66_41]PIU94959.1 MAG: hypothetical protein COS65_04920 [Armatimonadetes bacterium CG06_land_8_20_14_3_00_66_21]PIX38903.1 MAG: hypothetical protein COZ57_29445 [Armatimonadetes bacterium CG_4_8_14_3_um_filter_66_20]PJB60700.1 MAG: hypothetical protein CO096_32620 [Armatimonadetes bacterium CG_4_9_14_3_um_filter_66_14]
MPGFRTAGGSAVAHADHSLTGMRLRVAIDADRLEVGNPGMLPFGMTLDDFKAGVSRLRNRVIARVLRELGLVEEWGTGYLRMTQACREGGYPAPEWEEHGPCLRVVFRPHPEAVSSEGDVPASETANETVNERQKWFLSRLVERARVTWREITQHFQVARATAMRDLADLSDRGPIEFVGARKTGHYRLKEQP